MRIGICGLDSEKKGYIIENLKENLCYVRVGDLFYKRRSGVRYIKNEFYAHKVFYQEKLISLVNFYQI